MVENQTQNHVTQIGICKEKLADSMFQQARSVISLWSSMDSPPCS